MIPEPAFHDLHLHRWSSLGLSAIFVQWRRARRSSSSESCELPGPCIGDTPPGGVLVLLMLPQLQPQTPLLPPTLHLEPFLPCVLHTAALTHVNPLLYIPGPARGHLTDQVPTKQLPTHQQSLIRASSSPCPGPPRGPLSLLEPCFPGGDSETQVICLELGAGGLGDRAAEPRSKEQPMATGDSTFQVLRQ